MNSINKINLDLNNNNLIESSWVKKSLFTSSNKQWCNIIKVKSAVDLSEKYQSICQKHHTDNKWILMINPENEFLDQLSSMGKINPAKILKVNANKVNVNFEHIKKALLKGNCSAMILSNAHFNQAELNELANCAALGKTQCILLQQVISKLH
jgi:cell division inhibitor SulA